jgi:hypothetical protein
MRTTLLTQSPKRTDKANRESTFESGANQHKPAKRTRNRVPPPQRERILQKYVEGKSITDISKEEGRNRETVAKIVRGTEMEEYVRTMRERWFGLGQDAISAVEHALTEQKDGRLGFQLLDSIGVIPSPEERRSLALNRMGHKELEDGQLQQEAIDAINRALGITGGLKPLGPPEEGSLPSGNGQNGDGRNGERKESPEFVSQFKDRLPTRYIYELPGIFSALISRAKSEDVPAIRLCLQLLGMIPGPKLKVEASSMSLEEALRKAGDSCELPTWALRQKERAATRLLQEPRTEK